MRQRSPDPLIPNIGATQLVEHIPIHQPPNDLALPPALGIRAIDLQGPGMPAIIRQPDRPTPPLWLIARPPFFTNTAVGGAVGGRQAVDRLHDVELAAQGPLGAVVDGVAEHPEGGPEALALRGWVVAETDGRLEHGQLAACGCEGRLGLDACRRPFARFRLERDELDGPAAGNLEVLVGFGVGLDFAVCPDAGVGLGYHHEGRAEGVKEGL